MYLFSKDTLVKSDSKYIHNATTAVLLHFLFIKESWEK